MGNVYEERRSAPGHGARGVLITTDPSCATRSEPRGEVKVRRVKFVNASWFQNLFDARRKIAAWREEYNHERPHSSLGYRTPAEFARAIKGEEGCGKAAARKTEGRFPSPLGNPADAAGFPLSHSHDGGDSSLSGDSAMQENRERYLKHRYYRAAEEGELLNVAERAA